MEPREILDMTLQQLQSTFLAMTTSEWRIRLLGKPKKTKADAGRAFFLVHQARLALENEQLAAICEALAKNEKDLTKGKEALEKALTHLNRTKTVLNSVAKFLEIVGKVVDIL